jgi:hypothetical protein
MNGVSAHAGRAAGLPTGPGSANVATVAATGGALRARSVMGMQLPVR